MGFEGSVFTLFLLQKLYMIVQIYKSKVNNESPISVPLLAPQLTPQRKTRIKGRYFMCPHACMHAHTHPPQTLELKRNARRIMLFYSSTVYIFHLFFFAMAGAGSAQCLDKQTGCESPHYHIICNFKTKQNTIRFSQKNVRCIVHAVNTQILSDEFSHL